MQISESLLTSELGYCFSGSIDKQIQSHSRYSSSKGDCFLEERIKYGVVSPGVIVAGNFYDRENDDFEFKETDMSIVSQRESQIKQEMEVRLEI